jgi:hypothetical protein
VENQETKVVITAENQMFPASAGMNRYQTRQIFFREAVLAFLGVKEFPQPKSNRRQGIGEHCKGTDIAECQRAFGRYLDQVCATCPD